MKRALDIRDDSYVAMQRRTPLELAYMAATIFAFAALLLMGVILFSLKFDTDPPKEKVSDVLLKAHPAESILHHFLLLLLSLSAFVTLYFFILHCLDKRDKTDAAYFLDKEEFDA